MTQTTPLTFVSRSAWIRGWATATIVMSTRIMKKPTQSASIAAHGRPVTISSMPAFWPRAASLDCISSMLDLSDS